MTNPVIYAAAYLLLIGAPPSQVPVPSPIYEPTSTTIECQLPAAPGQPVSGQMSPHKLANNHISVRWVGNDPPGRRVHHHRHCHRWGRGWRCHS